YFGFRVARLRRLPGMTRTKGYDEHDTQRHHSRRRFRHAALSDHARDFQTAAAGVRQADDLLPAECVDACGYTRNPHYFDAARSAAVPATARGRFLVGVETG